MTEPTAPLPSGGERVGAIEIAFQVALVLFSAFFIWQATRVNQPPTTLVVGPRTFPLLVGGLMLVISIVLLWRSVRLATAPGIATAENDEAVPLDDDETAISDWSAIWTVLGATVALFLLLEPLGFIISMTIFLFGLSTYFAPQRWRSNFVVALVFSCFFFYLFAWLLGVPLPKGILAPFLTMMVG